MHCVKPFIMLMMEKMLKGEVLKSWDAFFAMLILWIILIQTLKIKKRLITYNKTYGIIGFKKKCGCRSCQNCKCFWRGYQ
jgi:hypothetical protein